MTEKINESQVMDMLKAEVEKAGEDYVYHPYDGENCVYSTEEKQPSCLVGQVVAHNVPELFDRLHEIEYDWNDDDTYTVLPQSVSSIQGMFLNYFTEPATLVLDQVQGSQDIGETWGEAIRLAGIRVS